MKISDICRGSLIPLYLCLPLNALAQTHFPIEPRPFHAQYTYADISYVDMIDGYNGIAANGSYRLQDNLNLLAGMISTSTDRSDYDVLRLSLGYNAAWPGTKLNIDYMSYAGLENRRWQHTTGTGSKVSEQNISLRAGTKLQVTLQPRLEAYTDLALTIIDNGQLTLNNGMIYHMTGRVSAQASYELGDRQQFNIGIRVTHR